MDSLTIIGYLIKNFFRSTAIALRRLWLSPLFVCTRFSYPAFPNPPSTTPVFLLASVLPSHCPEKFSSFACLEPLSYMVNQPIILNLINRLYLLLLTFNFVYIFSRLSFPFISSRFIFSLISSQQFLIFQFSLLLRDHIFFLLFLFQKLAV